MKRLLKYIYSMLPFKKPIFKLFRYFGPPHSIYQHLHFRSEITVQVHNNIQFKIQNDGHEIENEIFWRGLYGGWEAESLKLWSRLCENSQIIMDVGANTGVYSLLAAAVNPLATIYAFEPVPRIYKKLSQNVQLNSYSVNCMETALSNQDGQAIIYDTHDEHTYSVTVNKNLYPEKETREVKISVTQLSSLIDRFDISNIDLIKIDVETHEPEVLLGMKHYLKKFKPTLLIEVLNNDIARQIEILIDEINYCFFQIDEKRGPTPVSRIKKADFHNYLICSERTAEFLKILPDNHY